MLGGGISAVPQHGAQGMQWLTKFSASEGTRFFWNMARGLYPRPPIDPDLTAKETLNQLGPSILRQIKKHESDDAYFYWARLAVGFWDRLVAHRLTPAVARRVNSVGLASIPEILPLLLRGPWLVEVIEPLKGERLFGDTTALGGFCDPKTGYWNLVGWRIVDKQPMVRSMVTNQPWTAIGTRDLDPLNEDYQWSADGWHVNRTITRDGYREHSDWFQECVRFAMLLGALLEAENTFLRTRDEAPKKERDVSTKAGVPRPPGWITRYVGIDPEEGKRTVSKKSEPPAKPEQPPNTDGLSWVEVRVREHVRLQRCGERNQERRWVTIKAHTSHRWASQNPRRIIVGSG